jgi:glutamate-1-semialdehyde 2,1-aminomutase
MTTMAKIVAGGMPGGAVAGRKDIMEMVAFTDDKDFNKNRRVPQAGTYNANPLAAAAGEACLIKCADPAVQEYCDGLAAQLRTGINEAIVRKGSGGSVLGMRLEIAALLEGVHLFHAGGMTSTAHTQDDIEETVGVIDRAIGRIKDEGAFA